MPSRSGCLRKIVGIAIFSTPTLVLIQTVFIPNVVKRNV